ncbi:hypothetical protein [Sphingomonas carotinifaciens]|uniref:hypothetical protein n=1 Tax=Sphingomonas carotinifaciens TaxID=1166323 RepID=UPI001F26A0C3|nr:hypothetical protein [Sphingomonas carotinifaciens]
MAEGTRLPPQPAPAKTLGVDLTTVTRAYGKVQRLELIEGNWRRGRSVRCKAAADPAAVPFAARERVFIGYAEICCGWRGYRTRLVLITASRAHPATCYRR